MAGVTRRSTKDLPGHHAFGQWLGDRNARTDELEQSRSEPGAPRFPLVAHGYDRAVVDQRFEELEQELADVDRELAAQQNFPTRNNVEFDRIGEQVSAILIAAHESADEITRQAQSVADRRIEDAESHLQGLAENANQELARLQNELASLRRERENTLADIRRISDGLRALAEAQVQ